MTRRIGYKGGIISDSPPGFGGGLWFILATAIPYKFWAFLLGVCLIAMGLTVLENGRNPHTTLLGAKERGSTRISLAQSFNGISWDFGADCRGRFFYSDGGVAVAQGQLYIPYMGVAIIVLILAAMFYFADVPEIKVEDAYHTDDTSSPRAPTRE